jgi:hypothetical protein
MVRRIATTHCSIIALLLGISVLFYSGCSKRSGPGSDIRSFAIDESFDKGPLSVHVRVDANSVSIAQTLTLELEATIEEGYEVTMPRVDRVLEHFGILDWDKLGNRLNKDNALVETYRYRLEPFVSGTYDIPAFVFEFTDVNTPDTVHTLETEPLPVEITSLLGEDRENLTIADIEDVVDIPRKPNYAWAWLLGIVLLLGSGLGLWYFIKSRRPMEVIRLFKPAHELAYERLHALVADNLIETGHIKEFYERISNILRHYIEDRFRVRAPEQTTEEFLQELSQTDALPADDKSGLGEFLESCDLVKFARHEPQAEHIQKTFDLVKAFIEKTRSDTHKVDVTDLEPIGAATEEGND